MTAHALDGLKLTPCWRSFVGALHAALSVVDSTEYGLHELAGRTGFAFHINVHSDICPSGPTAFASGRACRRAFDQVGWDFDRFSADSSENTFSLVQTRAAAAIEAAVRRGVPAIVWGIDIGEYSIVSGCDGDKRVFSVSTTLGPEFDAKGLPYDRIGLGPVPIIDVYIPLEKVDIDPAAAAAESIKIAVGHALGAEAHLPGYANGLAAYGLWIEALRAGRAQLFGMAYNSAVYAEARAFAKEYLADLVSSSLLAPADLLAEAAKNYEHAADNLAALADMFPFSGDLPHDEFVSGEKAGEAAALLERALFWEHAGVRNLESVLKTLNAR